MAKHEIDLLISNGLIVTMDDRLTIIDGGSVAVEKDKILDLGISSEIESKYEARQTINASNMLIMPGLIDTHHHANPSAIMPGILERMDPKVYEYVAKLTAHPLSSKYAYLSSLMSCLISIKGGVTCVADYAVNPRDETKAVEESGMRGIKAVFLVDQESGEPEKNNEIHRNQILEDAMDFIMEWNGKADGRIRTCFGPDTEVVVSKNLLKDIVALANKHSLPIHIHASETLGEVKETKIRYGKRSIEYIYDLGVLRPGTVVGHGCWLSPRDISILAKSGASVSHAPVSGMLASAGITPVPQLVEAGVNVSLGRDIQPDMFQEIRTALLLPRINSLIDPNLVTCEQVVEMATINGARSLLWDDEIGSLELGKKADIILVDMTKPHITPVIREPELNAIGLLVFRAVSQDVDTVIVNGNILMNHGEVLTIDESKVIDEWKCAIEHLLGSSKIFN